jgi:uncharacterized OsmC-like protein
LGSKTLRFAFELEGDLDEAIRQRFSQLTERYCVILATLRHAPSLSIAIAGSSQP